MRKGYFLLPEVAISTGSCFSTNFHITQLFYIFWYLLDRWSSNLFGALLAHWLISSRDVLEDITTQKLRWCPTSSQLAQSISHLAFALVLRFLGHSCLPPIMRPALKSKVSMSVVLVAKAPKPTSSTQFLFFLPSLDLARILCYEFGMPEQKQLLHYQIDAFVLPKISSNKWTQHGLDVMVTPSTIQHSLILPDGNYGSALITWRSKRRPQSQLSI